MKTKLWNYILIIRLFPKATYFTYKADSIFFVIRVNKRFFLFSSSINSIKKMKGLDWLEWHVGPVCFGHEHVGEGKKWTKNLGQHICKNGLKWHVGAVCYASQMEFELEWFFKI